MDKEKIIIRLSTQADTIKAHVNRLKKSGYNVHSLDVDMLRKKTIEFYELVFELEETFSVAEPVTKKVVIPEPEPPVSEIKVQEVEVIPVILEEETPVIEETVEVVEKLEVVEEPVIVEPVVVPPPPPEPEPTVTQSPPVIEKPEPVREMETEEKLPEMPESHSTSPQTTYDLFAGNSDHPVAEK